MKAAEAEGVVFSTGVTDRLSRGEAALAKAWDASEPAARAGHSNDSLADTMWAGEMAAVRHDDHGAGFFLSEQLPGDQEESQTKQLRHQACFAHK